MIYNDAKKSGNLAQPEGDFFILTDSGEVLGLSKVVQGGAHYQVLASSEPCFISTEKLREGVAGNWEILTNVAEALVYAVVAQLEF